MGIPCLKPVKINIQLQILISSVETAQNLMFNV